MLCIVKYETSLLACLSLLHQVSCSVVPPNSSNWKDPINICMRKLHPVFTAVQLMTHAPFVARCAQKVCIRMMKKLQVILRGQLKHQVDYSRFEKNDGLPAKREDLPTPF